MKEVRNKKFVFLFFSFLLMLFTFSSCHVARVYSPTDTSECKELKDKPDLEDNVIFKNYRMTLIKVKSTHPLELINEDRHIGYPTYTTAKVVWLKEQKSKSFFQVGPLVKDLLKGYLDLMNFARPLKWHIEYFYSPHLDLTAYKYCCDSDEVNGIKVIFGPGGFLNVNRSFINSSFSIDSDTIKTVRGPSEGYIFLYGLKKDTTYQYIIREWVRCDMGSSGDDFYPYPISSEFTVTTPNQVIVDSAPLTKYNVENESDECGGALTGLGYETNMVLDNIPSIFSDLSYFLGKPPEFYFYNGGGGNVIIDGKFQLLSFYEITAINLQGAGKKYLYYFNGGEFSNPCNYPGNLKWTQPYKLFPPLFSSEKQLNDSEVDDFDWPREATFFSKLRYFIYDNSGYPVLAVFEGGHSLFIKGLMYSKLNNIEYLLDVRDRDDLFTSLLEGYDDWVALDDSTILGVKDATGELRRISYREYKKEEVFDGYYPVVTEDTSVSFTIVKGGIAIFYENNEKYLLLGEKRNRGVYLSIRALPDYTREVTGTYTDAITGGNEVLIKYWKNTIYILDGNKLNVFGFSDDKIWYKNGEIISALQPYTSKWMEIRDDMLVISEFRIVTIGELFKKYLDDYLYSNGITAPNSVTQDGTNSSRVKEAVRMFKNKQLAKINVISLDLSSQFNSSTIRRMDAHDNFYYPFEDLGGDPYFACKGNNFCTYKQVSNFGRLSDHPFFVFVDDSHIMFPGGYLEGLPEELINAFIDSKGYYPISPYSMAVTGELQDNFISDIRYITKLNPIRFIARPEPLVLKVR